MATTTLTLPCALLPQVAWAAAPPTTTVITGRGNGHGVGLPQDGALSLGRAGKSAAQILDTFYPGTTLQSDRSARMHVEVWQSAAATSTQLRLPQGGKIYGPAGHVAVPAGAVVTLALSGSDWAARLGLPAGTGGRSLPRRRARGADDPPSATPSPDTSSDDGSSATDPAPDPSATPGGVESSAEASAVPPAASSGAPTPSDPGSPVSTSASAPSAAAASPTPPEPTAAAGRRGTAASPPVAPPQSVAGSAAPLLTVTGDDLDIVPATPDGVTTIVSTGRSYRGQIRTAPGELINDVPLELYLRGLGEVLDPSWPQAGLQAFVVAARTYALRDALGAADPGDHQHVNICATDACQVYLGAGVEYPQLTQAVAATAGKVLEYRGGLADTYYSASAGGETATPAEGFGADSTDVPYLRAVAYDDGGHDGWQRTIDLGAAATALHYPGKLTEIEVTGRGPSGRASTAMLHGTAGDLPVTGLALASALGLPSTLFATGFGVSAPQIDDVVGPTTLPALTAASLGQVAVPSPVLAPQLTSQVDLGQPVVVLRLPGSGVAPRQPAEAAAGLMRIALRAADPRSVPGVITWLTLLALMTVIALVGRPARPRGRHLSR